MNGLTPGSIVRCRKREWVMLPSEDGNLFRLRPLTGSEIEVCAIHRELANLGLDRVEPAYFPPPTVDDVKDGISAELLWQASRLTLREGAGPFRSLGRISVRPRPYQFVPLMMALRLDPVRLLIADDVGIGKTIEALIIARELLDRGEIRRLCVLCPPYLCDQWQKELHEKFHIDAVVIRSGTVGQLERQMPPGDYSVFSYYPFTVVSIDYAKTDLHRASFLLHSPNFVIVDEAHGAAAPSSQSRAQQQRHQLLRDLAKDDERHLIMLTATPHSGIEGSFRSLLGLLQQEFADYNIAALTERRRDKLAKHFVQRRRADVEKWLGEDTTFPERIAQEEPYELSKPYRELFEKVYEFSRELVETGESLTKWKQRIRYWSALALLRCVMSSPSAAISAIENRHSARAEDEEATDQNLSSFIYEPTDELATDVQPAYLAAEDEIPVSEQHRLYKFAKAASKLKGVQNDRKLARCVELVRSLLVDGYQPIIWCRYIATSDYVAHHLASLLGKEFKDLRVISVTGAMSDDERRVMIDELRKYERRVLVATDCLSEGVNLQQYFSAVMHYDLPWNPNRLEQREGRVDRFGQTAQQVKAVLLYGRDNVIDGAVLDVLLRKAKEIHKALGVTVPIPTESETVMESVIKALFFRSPRKESAQLSLFEDAFIPDLHKRWEKAAEREKENRSKFAQRSIKPEEVQRELEESDGVLGDSKAVESFVLNSCQRLQVGVSRSNNCHWIMSSLNQMPDMVKSTLPSEANGTWRIGFTSPVLPGVTYLGRNHPFVATLAQYLMEESLTKGARALAARCGVIRTTLVERRTVLSLLRLRFLVSQAGVPELLAEEVFICGYRGFPPHSIEWIEDSKARELIESAAKNPVDVPTEERRELLDETLTEWKQLDSGLTEIIQRRAVKLEEAHRRVRASLRMVRRGLAVKPQTPADLLGLVILQPVAKGVVR